MSDISFKKFSAFVDSEEVASDEQLSEIFGIFRNNSKLEKLKAEREKLKGLKAAKAAELDKALKNMAAGKRPGVMSDTDLEGALGSDDRKYLAKDDAYRDKKAKEIRLRLGMKEAVVMEPLRKIKEPGWYVVDHMDKPVEGPMQEGAAKDRADELSGEVTGDIAAFSAEYYSDYDIKRMNEALDMTDEDETTTVKFSGNTPVAELKAEKKYLEKEIEACGNNRMLCMKLKQALKRIEGFLAKNESQDTLDRLIDSSLSELAEEHGSDSEAILDSLFEKASVRERAELKELDYAEALERVQEAALELH